MILGSVPAAPERVVRAAESQRTGKEGLCPEVQMCPKCTGTCAPCKLLEGDSPAALVQGPHSAGLSYPLPPPAQPNLQPRACSLSQPPDAFRVPTVCQAHAGDGNAEVPLANPWPRGNPASRQDKAREPAGRGRPAPVTGAEEPSPKEVLRREFARRVGRENHPQGLEGHEERGGSGTGQARAGPAWVPTRRVQTSALSASLRHLSRMLIQGLPDLFHPNGRLNPTPKDSVHRKAGEALC